MKNRLQSAFQFRLVYLEDDIFLFDHACTIKPNEGLYRRFNRVGGLIEPQWYRFSQDSPFVIRAEEFDFVG
jgi:hypothetical protein